MLVAIGGYFYAVVSIVLFVPGVTTLLHTIFGPSFVYLAPTSAIINSPEFQGLNETATGGTDTAAVNVVSSKAQAPPTSTKTLNASHLHETSYVDSDVEDLKHVTPHFNDADGSSEIGMFLVEGKIKPRRGENFTFLEALVKADFWFLFFVYFPGVRTSVTVINNLTQVGAAQGVEDFVRSLEAAQFKDKNDPTDSLDDMHTDSYDNLVGVDPLPWNFHWSVQFISSPFMSLKVCVVRKKECVANIPLHTIYTVEDLHPNLEPSACTCHQRNTDSNNFNSFWFQALCIIFQIHVIR
ncbi:hypothetical protein RYX36_011477 [Vicia faba]